MDIYPQDLGRKAQEELQRQRTHPPETVAGPRTEARPHQTHAPQRAIWALFSMACWCAIVAALAFGLRAGLILAVIIALFGIALGPFSGALRRRLARRHGPTPTRRSLEGKLSALDISRLKRAANGGAEARYCDLLMAAILTPPLADATTENGARTAVRALGAAVEDLPAHDPNAIHDNSGDLVVQAAGLAVDADHEADPVVADSLRRRAEAMRRQAETVAWTVTAVRRSHALRAEVAGQIDALRSSLVALSIGGTQSTAEMMDLAASIQTVAAAAHAIIAARAEVESALSTGEGPATEGGSATEVAAV